MLNNCFRIWGVAIALCTVLAMPEGARAASPSEGGGCSTAGAFAVPDVSEVVGGGHFLVCDGSTWTPFLGYKNSGVAIPTFVNQGSCANGDKVTYDAGTGGLWCGDLPTGCSDIADQCDDNSIYIGNHPTEAGVKLYATATNDSSSIDWSTAEYGTEIEPQGYPDSWTDGETNQQWIVDNKTLSDYPAFELCENLDRHDHQDWYLPALAELDLVYSNLMLDPPGDDSDNPTNPNSGGGGTTDPTARDGPWAGTFSTDFYWSSSESTSAYAWLVYFYDGGQDSFGAKNSNYDVRCVRRVP